MAKKHSKKLTVTLSKDSFKVTKSQLNTLMKLRGQEASTSLEKDFNGVTGLCESLLTSPVTGLTESEGDIEERRRQFGRNVIPPKKAKSIFELAWETMQDLTLIILTVAAIVSIGLSFYKSPPAIEDGEVVEVEETSWIDGAAIMLAVVVVVSVTSVNDWKKERQFRGLQSKIANEQKIMTTRKGVMDELLIKDLVVGDIAYVKYGDLIPADGVLIQGSDLQTDESSLTGETDLIKKNDTNPVLLSGTRVMEGSGQMVVTAVGENSQAGIIFTLLSEKESEESIEETEEGEGEEDGKSPFKQKSVLQAKLTRLTVQIGFIGIGIAVLTLVILVVRFCVEKYAVKKLGWSNSHIQHFITFIITAVTILVVAIPEGLPLAVTIALAYSVVKMMSDNNLVRHLDACETMGGATAICSDKTGTLTTNRMTTVQAYINGRFYAKVDECAQLPVSIRRLLSDAISINSGYTTKIVPSDTPGAPPLQLGNKTECGLLGFVRVLGHDYEKVREEFPERDFTKVYTFNSVRKSMSTVIALPVQEGGGFRLFSKGASEIILNKCQWILGENGEIRSFASTDRTMVAKTVIEPMASSGLRTICVAYKDFRPLAAKAKDTGDTAANVEFYEGPNPDWDNEAEIVSKLICIGIMGIEDPVRPEVPEAIVMCQRAGITVRMVTGDNVATARSIAYKCGILSPGDNYLVLDGKEFNQMIRDTPDSPVSQEKIDQIWPQLRVLARSSPEDKYVLVRGMIASNINDSKEVVAVTGDGTNDGPALKVADVGFAMGITGTEVAKEASDIILMDDNFSSIVKAVMWGRNVYDSISKFIQFQLTVNVVAVTTAFIGACVMGKSPLAATQMLWINLVMDTLASLALATELPTKELLERRPYGRDDYIISPVMFCNILFHSVYQLAVLFTITFAGEALFDVDPNFGLDSRAGYVTHTHFTLIFNTLVMMTLFNELNARQIRRVRNIFTGLLSNRLFVVIWIGSFIAQVLIVQFGSTAFQVTALTVDEWGWCLLLGMGELVWHQITLFIPVDRLRKSKVTPEMAGAPVEHVGVEHVEEKEDIRRSKVLWFRAVKRMSEQVETVRSFQADRIHPTSHGDGGTHRSTRGDSLHAVKV